LPRLADALAELSADRAAPERWNDAAASNRLRSIALHPVYKLTRQTLKNFIGGVLETLRQTRHALANPATLLAGDDTRSRLIVACIGGMPVKKISFASLIRDLNKDTITRAGFKLCAVDHK